MRIITLALAVVAATSACGGFKRGGQPPAHREPTSTSIYGEWVLVSPIDSTAFVGASKVEMSLEPVSFRIHAFYPDRSAPVVITGSVTRTKEGLLTLTPSSGDVGQVTGRHALMFTPGTPINLVASSAGGSLVFNSPEDDTPTPTSIWNRRAQAEAAGLTPKDSTKP